MYLPLLDWLTKSCKGVTTIIASGLKLLILFSISVVLKNESGLTVNESDLKFPSFKTCCKEEVTIKFSPKFFEKS